MDPTHLPVFWAGMIAFGILVYVILDGFDLGIGVLFGLTGREDFRQQMQASIAPVWDGNETWLVLIGASLYAAFPIVYAIFLPAFYLPVALLLFALIFRGVAFEFRHQDHRARPLWDWGFVLGSGVAAFIQGAAVGTMVQELPVVNGRFAGTGWEWLSLFPLLCGLGLVLGYALLGAAWLVLKTEGELRAWACGWVRPLLFAVLTFLALAFAFAVASQLDVMNRWLESPWLLVFPVVGALATLGLLRWDGTRRRDWPPLLYTAVIFGAAFATLAGSFWPYMIPYSVTIEAAAAPTASLEFLFYGAALVVFPIVLIYTGVVYWIFRGKVTSGGSYSH